MFLYEKLASDLYDYNPQIYKPEDFDSFWAQTKELAKEKLEFSIEAASYPLKARIFKVTLKGYDDTSLSGWYLLPENDQKTYPLCLFFHGYRGYASSPSSFASYLLNGIGVLAFDLRGQVGTSGDSGYEGGHVPGWVTQGLDNPYECYYRRLILDALRMVDLARSLPDVDPKRIMLQGGSQGGGLTLATAALSEHIALAVAAVPNMCLMEQGVLYSTSSLKEVIEYLRLYPDKAPAFFKTLSYFDNVNLAPAIKCPVLVSVGMQDTVCLPKGIFAAYNRILAPKEILVFPFSGHDGGGENYSRAAMEFALKHLKP